MFTAFGQGPFPASEILEQHDLYGQSPLCVWCFWFRPFQWKAQKEDIPFAASFLAPPSLHAAVLSITLATLKG